MNHFFKNLSIKFKLFIAYAGMSLFIFTLSFALLFFLVQKNLEHKIKTELNRSNQIITDMVETTATVSIKNHLRAIAEKSRQISAHFHQKFLNGEITESNAKDKAVEVLLSQTVGDTGYLYCINSKGKAVVHPQKDVLGKNFSYRNFIQKQIREKEGYLEYEWQNPDETQSRSKALYMSYFEPWDWIISVSSYKSEFIKLIGIDDFKDRILDLTFGETGYSFIIDTQGNSIIHPELSGNVLDMAGADGFPIAREMVRQKKGYITYLWENPSDSKPREKFVAFDYIPSFEWIIASSSYTNEVFAPLHKLQKIFLIILVLSLLLIAAVTLAVSTSITKPLMEFIRQLENRSPDDWSDKLVHEGKDEIGKLSASFNRFMDRLDTYHKKLVSEISVRKQAEQENKLLAAVIEQAGETVVITDKEGCIQYVNPAFERMTGYTRKEIIGLTHGIVKSGKHDSGFYNQLWDTILSGLIWQGNLINKRKDGRIYEEEATITPIVNPEGSIINFAAVKRDVTNEKKLESRLRQAQKMEAIGSLAGGIAHDFNNILFPIAGLSEMLLDDLPQDSKEHQSVQKILTASQRGSELVRQILAFGRQSESKLIPVQFQSIVKEALKLCRSTIPKDIQIHQEIQKDCGFINANPTQLHQIAMNLITNAYHAVEANHGEITVRLSETIIEKRDISTFSLEPGRYAILTVSDTGTGIDPAAADKLFDPYFTTKEKGKGSGLGLSVVHGIVKEYGGDVKVYSELGKGTTFNVYIPLIEKTVETRAEETVEIDSSGNERLLLVDDEEPIAKMEAAMLERLGYQVTSRTESVDALEAFKANPGAFDLVLTDMAMPNMAGDHLASELMSIRPDIPVIICTGFSERINREKAEAMGIKALLMKPVAMEEMAQAIRKVLDESTA